MLCDGCVIMLMVMAVAEVHCLPQTFHHRKERFPRICFWQRFDDEYCLFSKFLQITPSFLQLLEVWAEIQFLRYVWIMYRPRGKFLDHAPYCVNNAAARGEAAATSQKRVHQLSSPSVVQWKAVTVTPSEIWISQEPWQVSQNGFESL